MRKRMLCVGFLALGLWAPSSLLAADDPRPAAPAGDQAQKNQTATDRPRDRGPGRGGPGRGLDRGPRGLGGPGGFGGFGMARGMTFGDPFHDTLNVLSELNMSADFTLTTDQKTKIAATKDQLQKQRDKWRADHEADLKAIGEQFANLRGDGAPGDNREKMTELMSQRRELMESAPKGDESLVEIKGLLTTDQLKKLDEALAKHKAELEQAQKDMRDRMERGGFGQGRRGEPGRGNNGRGGPDRGGRGGAGGPGGGPDGGI